MAGIVVIGAELDCAGFRLAGVDTRCPAEGELAIEFSRALAEASLVVLTQRCADQLAPGELRRALAHEAPLVVVVPDIGAPQADTGLVNRIRGVLGISP